MAKSKGWTLRKPKIIKKILVIKFRHIGDVLLSTPLIENLAHHYLGARIDYALNKDCAEMMTLNPFVNHIITYDRAKIKNQNFFARLASELSFIFKIRRAHYDLVISLTEGDRGAYLTFLSGATIKLGFKPKKGLFSWLAVFQHFGEIKAQHTVEKDLQFIPILNKKIISKKVSLYYGSEDIKIINTLLAKHQLKKFIHLHAMSRWLFKCIADKTVAQIIDYCQKNLKYKIVLTAADDEKEVNKIKNIIALCSQKPINLAGKLSLKQVGILNQKSRFFIGVDSAIMHISAANNTPTFAFFGPSGARQWGPWDNEVSRSGYRGKKGMQRMGRHQVFSESRGCQPCGKAGCDNSQISDCLMSLDFKMIKSHIQAMLNASI